MKRITLVVVLLGSVVITVRRACYNALTCGKSRRELRREGVTPTCKKLKGFEPLQVFWNRLIVYANLREGTAHSNHGTHVVRNITELVRLIRNHSDRRTRYESAACAPVIGVPERLSRGTDPFRFDKRAGERTVGYRTLVEGALRE